MLVSMIIHLQFPSAYNGNWWAFCYASILFWFTIYCFICNPFGFKTSEIVWFSLKHIPLLVYVVGINAISALVLYSLRKKKFGEKDIKHTLVLMLGALGGTVGAIPMAFYIRQLGKYSYVVIGFFVMIMSQIAFIMYMMSAGVF